VRDSTLDTAVFRAAKIGAKGSSREKKHGQRSRLPDSFGGERGKAPSAERRKNSMIANRNLKRALQKKPYITRQKGGHQNGEVQNQCTFLKNNPSDGSKSREFFRQGVYFSGCKDGKKQNTKFKA